MLAVLRPFVWITRGVRAFFRADLSLRRGRRGLEVVLDERPKAVRPAADKAARRKPSARDEQREQEVLAMRRALSALLDELPENRRALRHLAFVEQGLRKNGLDALDRVPFEVLRRALDQFEAVVTNWSDEALAALRSKMAVALIERERENPNVERDAPAQHEEADETLDSAHAELAHPIALEGDEAAEAEAALRAAYGAVEVGGLDLATDVQLHGELGSPSAQALTKAQARAPAAHV